LIGCGIVQAHYAFQNISTESLTTVTYFIQMLSSTSDCIIFLYLGMAIFKEHVWDPSFIIWTLLFCLIVRFITVYFLSYIINLARRNVKPISLREMFIMAYGGLRGAVGFSLVSMINESHLPEAKMMVTTTLVVVIFTVFLQGGTIKFLVEHLNIEKKSDSNVTLAEEINTKVFKNVMAGIEIITGEHGDFYVQNMWKHFERSYMKKWLCEKEYENKIKKIYEEILLADHFLHLYGPNIISRDTVNNSKKTDDGYVLVNQQEKSHIVQFWNKNLKDFERCNSLPVQRDPGHLSLHQAFKDEILNIYHQVQEKNPQNTMERHPDHRLRRRNESARKNFRSQFSV